MLIDYSLYYFCRICQLPVLQKECKRNNTGNAVCPRCNHRVRTRPHQRKSQAREHRGL